MAGKVLNIALGVLFWVAVLGFSLTYEARHGLWLQEIVTVIMMALIAYLVIRELRTAVKNKSTSEEERGRYLVGECAQPRYFATRLLVGLCVAASLIGWMLPNKWYINEGAVGRVPVLVHHEWWRLISSAFLHANTMHLWFNMAALWVLGEQLETMLGSLPLLYIYFASALGGEIAVIAFGQEHTLGASGAIYGLLGANTLLAWNAWKHGFRQTGRRMLTASAVVIGFNLLFSAAIPFISLAAHVGGLVTGFLIAMSVGVPNALRTSWALTDGAPRGVHYTCDAKGRLFYNGPARYPLAWGWISRRDIATAVDKDTTPQIVLVQHADPDELLIACPLPEGVLAAPSYANAGSAEQLKGTLSLPNQAV